MEQRQRRPSRRFLTAIGAVLLAALIAGCSGETAPVQPAASPDPEMTRLEQTVKAKETQIAALERQVEALQTEVAKPAPTETVTVQPSVPSTPSPTSVAMAPAADDTSKGSLDAKVVITEYSDYQ